jgi:hypothetical protein
MLTYLMVMYLCARPKKEDYIVGTDQRRKITLLEQIKEERPHCWNRSKKEDYIVETDQRRNTTLLEQIKYQI